MPHGRPLHELPCLRENLDGSMLSSSTQTSKRKSRGPLGAMGVHAAETTPNELIQHWSPPHKQPRVTFFSSKGGKENQDGPFVLARRSRKRRDSTALSCWDSLPDEVLLRILFCLPMRELLKASRVCKRWHRLAFDESLWHSVDLEGVVQMDSALGQALNARVRRLRCPRSVIVQPHIRRPGGLKIWELDLSNCTIAPETLSDIVFICRRLRKLSLEGLELNQDVIESLRDNEGLEELNLCGCSGFSSPGRLGSMLESCSKMLKLNISWCDFSHAHVKAVVAHVSSGVLQLNLSGYRQNLVLEDVETLVERCPNLTVLDLSDSVLLTIDAFPVLQQLNRLVTLGLSRCYQIHPAALAELETFPSLKLLQAYGLAQDTCLKNYFKRISVNTDPFSGIARPSAAYATDGRMWNQKCRLKYRP